MLKSYWPGGAHPWSDGTRVVGPAAPSLTFRLAARESLQNGPPCPDTESDGMDELVLVDFDDTLVETAPAFEKARKALFQRLEDEGFLPEDVFRVHHELVEPELLDLFGMGPFRLAPSFRDTYIRLCAEGNRKPDPSVAGACEAMGMDFMGHPRIMDGALESLQELSRYRSAVIYSQASHPEYQLQRIRDAGVLDIIPRDRVRITFRKTRESFLEALAHFGGIEARRALMVGNSLRSDINPALEAGAKAMLVEPYEMWHYDNVPPVSQDFLRFSTFPEAVAAVLDPGGRKGEETP